MNRTTFSYTDNSVTQWLPSPFFACEASEFLAKNFSAYLTKLVPGFNSSCNLQDPIESH